MAHWEYALFVLPLAFVFVLWILARSESWKRLAQISTAKETQRPAIPARRQVWHSSYTIGSSLRHVALFVGKNKYEIRRDAESQEIKFSTKSYSAVVNAASFSVNLHCYNADTDANSQVVGADGPFSLYLGKRQETLQFNLIGFTTKTDSEIIQYCKKLDQRFVYDRLFNNCHHFAFILARTLVKPEDRAAVWNILFGPKDYQLEDLAQILETMDRLAISITDAQVSQEPDASSNGGAGDSGADCGFYFNDSSGGTVGGEFHAGTSGGRSHHHAGAGSHHHAGAGSHHHAGAGSHQHAVGGFHIHPVGGSHHDAGAGFT